MASTSRALLTLLATLLLAAAGTATAQAQSLKGRFTTEFRGPTMCLDTVNGGLDNDQARLAPCGAFSGQLWTVRVNPGGFLTLTNDFRGPGMCLDVVNGGDRDNQVELHPCGNFSGQHWRDFPAGDFAQLSQDFRPELCLDVVNGGARDNFVELRPCANVTGQHWKFTPEGN